MSNEAQELIRRHGTLRVPGRGSLLLPPTVALYGSRYIDGLNMGDRARCLRPAIKLGTRSPMRSSATQGRARTRRKRSFRGVFQYGRCFRRRSRQRASLSKRRRALRVPPGVPHVDPEAVAFFASSQRTTEKRSIGLLDLQRPAGIPRTGNVKVWGTLLW